MSEPKLISPMLDNFAMGDPISDRNGVRCCPAMEKDSDNKYIVKIISIPASQTQLDALLLSGAYSSVEAADEYFKTLSDGVIQEAAILEKLSKLEGFLPYTACQLQPMQDETGYDVYLLSPYRTTLAQQLRHGSMTHLAALNLALDICAALLVCRRSGYLYVDLKPENIYLEQGKSCKIGDIGFIDMNSLRFASLPERYRSAYTAPEIIDAYASVNTTVDVYALGLILYQVFNDGLLPSQNEDNSNDVFPPPAYADYEMAEIILKACNPKPDNRWQDPVEMGQAIVSYMQRNGAHDTPIVPVPEPESATVSECAVIDTPADDVSEAEEQIEEIIEPAPQPDDDAESDTVEITPELTDNEFTEEQENTTAETEDVQQEESEPYDDSITNGCEDVAESNGQHVAEQEKNQSEISDDFDETLPEESDEAIDYAEISAEVSDILMQADDLISHPAPEPVIPPEPIDVPIPPPLPIEPEEPVESEDEAEETDEETPLEDADPDQDEIEMADSDNNQESEPRKKSHWLRNLIIAVVVLAIASVGLLFYTRYYLQPIDSIILQEHENGDLTVIVSSPVDENELTVICSDTYGNQLTRPVSDGKAVFTGLAPGSAYTVNIAINGFHKLTGDTTAAFTTPTQTNIVQFRAVTGSEDGSVILSFTIDGPDSDQWQIQYSAADVPEQTATFTGHMHTITGLTVGTEYTLKLSPVTNLNYIGNTELKHTAKTIVKANNLQITGCLNNTLTAVWEAPADSTVDNWTVRCYNDANYDKTVVVNETSVAFEGIDTTSAYTVEVTASGMSVSERAFAAANSVTVTDFTADESNANSIVLTWNSNGYTPTNGWLLLYTVDGSAAQEITGVTGDTATLDTRIPGSNYNFTLQSADGASILGGQLILKTADAKSFSGYGVSAKYMDFKMCERPNKKKWDRYDLSSSDYTSSFAAGEKASFLVKLKREYDTSKDSITTLYVIRDENGTIISAASTKSTWTKMWYRNYCELDIPSIPQTAGKYTISVYFNGALAHSQNFKVTS